MNTTDHPIEQQLPQSARQRIFQVTKGLLEGVQMPINKLAEIGDETVVEWAARHGIPTTILGQAVADLVHAEYTDTLANWKPSAVFIRRFPIVFARQYGVIGLVDASDNLYLALGSLDSWPVLNQVARILKIHPQPLFAPSAEILRIINVSYEQQCSQPEHVLDSISLDQTKLNLQALDQRDDLLISVGRTPVVELVNVILLDAVKAAVSDVHFQPHRDKLIVRYRIDGVLFNAHELPKEIQDETLSRVKVMGKMNIAEKRLPQDGRATVLVGDRMIDLRMASLPGSNGERVVLRLLDKSSQILSLTQLGLGEDNLKRFRDLIKLEHGLILLTGPTGSGKTTTLYAALQEINTLDRNVVTLEDPIEYDIEGVSQTQINNKKGLTFASGLRNVLRQDPDIIMVGEIRDQETAVMAIQSALTGHLVFSTLHTNDAASAVTRLLDLGIEPYLVSSSLLAVLAQRLVRKVCIKCAADQPFSSAEREQLGLGDAKPSLEVFRSGAGCSFCRNTGFRGRVAISELLVVDESIRTQIQARAGASEIREAAQRNGMRILREDGIEKVMAGITTPSEVNRVTVRSTQ